MHLTHDPASHSAEETEFDTFLKVDVRAGRIVRAEAFPEARNPAYKLWIDFGPGIGEKKSAAQITEHYALDDLPGQTVMAVVNFPPRQIGPVRSEVLVLGFADQDGAIRLARPDGDVPLGARLS
ncbi:tRNA-binding protein [Hyphobacterium sp. HN65]|uniref:tRNA-binding protein n=1 Tax=Hyphobacterium lacteum TaxID=3116575 RepID=A0ABU7LLZ8_9PROT|nr:tRNA-binding protein [Hyphobacterium sp. HN65]MEE2524958.1 tRNA-binding protein [Hyphobacterium sp. HN65]